MMSPACSGAADIHCQPNESPEPFGIAFVEALWAGLPVVTVGVGGAAEIVNDSCGLLIPPANPRALADALHALIDDPARRARLGAAGQTRAAALCDPAHVIPEFHAALSRTIDSAPAGSTATPKAEPAALVLQGVALSQRRANNARPSCHH